MVESVSRPVRRLAVVALLALQFTPALHAQDQAAVRVLHPVLARTLRDALAASATLQRIVREIEQSDLIVHVVGLPPKDRPRHVGTMQFVSASACHRLLRVGVDVRLPAERRAEMLGHELFHALEVARARDVVDSPSFAALYRRIGHGSQFGFADRYETAEAQRAGRRVLIEVRHPERFRQEGSLHATEDPR